MTSTEQCACETTPVETLPRRSFLNPPRPRVPITIKSTFSFSANSTIAPTVDETGSITSPLASTPASFASQGKTTANRQRPPTAAASVLNCAACASTSRPTCDVMTRPLSNSMPTSIFLHQDGSGHVEQRGHLRVISKHLAKSVDLHLACAADDIVVDAE